MVETRIITQQQAATLIQEQVTLFSQREDYMRDGRRARVSLIGVSGDPLVPTIGKHIITNEGNFDLNKTIEGFTAFSQRRSLIGIQLFFEAEIPNGAAGEREFGDHGVFYFGGTVQQEQDGLTIKTRTSSSRRFDPTRDFVIQ